MPHIKKEIFQLSLKNFLSKAIQPITAAGNIKRMLINNDDERKNIPIKNEINPNFFVLNSLNTNIEKST